MMIVMLMMMLIIVMLHDRDDDDDDDVVVRGSRQSCTRNRAPHTLEAAGSLLLACACARCQDHCPDVCAGCARSAVQGSCTCGARERCQVRRHS